MWGESSSWRTRRAQPHERRAARPVCDPLSGPPDRWPDLLAIDAEALRLGGGLGVETFAVRPGASIRKRAQGRPCCDVAQRLLQLGVVFAMHRWTGLRAGPWQSTLSRRGNADLEADAGSRARRRFLAPDGIRRLVDLNAGWHGVAITPLQPANAGWEISVASRGPAAAAAGQPLKSTRRGPARWKPGGMSSRAMDWKAGRSINWTAAARHGAPGAHHRFRRPTRWPSWSRRWDRSAQFRRKRQGGF